MARIHTPLMFLAFRYSHGKTTMVGDRVAGQLYRFPNRYARKRFLMGVDLPDDKDSYDCVVPSHIGEYRAMVNTVTLPKGWKLEDAEEKII